MRATRVLIAMGLIVAAGLLVARQLGRFLVVADPLPDRADAIVMMAGSPSDRALEAARLYGAGVAPRVVLTRERLPRGAAALRARGIRLPEGHDLARQALIGLGVSPDAIRVLGRRTASTTTEAETIARWACTHGARRLVVVTSPSHTRRARLILRRALGPRVALTVRPAPDALFPAAHWWRRRRAMKQVLGEYQKLVVFWTLERWRIRPCGGLPSRSAWIGSGGTKFPRMSPCASRSATHCASCTSLLRPALACRPAGSVGTQRCSAAFRTNGASSPLACSSRTTSQPPTNSPPTNTCGMVGQLV